MPRTSYIFIRNVHGHKISKEIIQKSVSASKPKCLNMIAESDNKYIVDHTKMNQSSSKHYMLVCLFAWWCLRLLSTIFQLYRGGMFYWWRKPEDPEKTNDLSFVRQSLSHNVVHLGLIEIPTHNIGGDKHWLHR